MMYLIILSRNYCEVSSQNIKYIPSILTKSYFQSNDTLITKWVICPFQSSGASIPHKRYTFLYTSWCTINPKRKKNSYIAIIQVIELRLTNISVNSKIKYTKNGHEKYTSIGHQKAATFVTKYIT